MAIQYREDNDLEFLEYCPEEDLKMLAIILTHNPKDNGKRLTSQLASEEEFQKLAGQPDQYRKCWQLIAAELQLFGGDSMANFIRGHGVTYRKILTDVCKRLGIKYDEEATTFAIENELISQSVEKLWNELSTEDKEKIFARFNIKTEMDALHKLQQAILNDQETTYQISALLSALANYKWQAIFTVAAGSVSRLLPKRLAVTAGISSSLASSILIAASAIPIATSPAFRVTHPACLQIAYMRRKYIAAEEEHVF